jgi:cytochrome c oxidase subunit 2
VGFFMKRGIVALAGLGLALALTGCGSSATPPSNTPSQTANPSGTTANAQVVHVAASNFKWTLDKTTFKAGQPIEFVLEGKESAHGFSIDGTNVNQTIVAGETKTVTWTPPQPGTYTIRCNLFCGSGHANMYTTFTVQ